jgi:nitrite reductase/ring-hydroxylating ferredoxin subunit
MSIADFFRRILGICRTQPPTDTACWRLVDDNVEIDLSRSVELQQPNGAIRLEGKSLPVRLLVFRGEDGQFHAFPNRCTHAGHRRLDPLPGRTCVRCCSVGQSVFDYQGNRQSGSASEPIRPLKVVERENTLVIALGQLSAG